MKSLLTGITGFAGTHLAEHLLACGDEVLGCSRGGTWPAHAPRRLVDAVPLFRWDMQEPPPRECLAHIAAFQPEIVYHLGAISIPGACGDTEPSAEALAVNVGGTGRVGELALGLSPRPRVVLVSSRHVYGPVPADSPLVDESFAAQPQSAYGKTKLAAERLAQEMIETRGADVVIARAFSHAGPRQLPPLLLAEWCAQLAAELARVPGQVEVSQLPLRIENDNTWLDLSDVRDVVRAYRLLAARGQTGEIYNVGSGLARRTGDIAAELVALAAPGRPVEAMSHDERRHPVADTGKLHAHTGWRAEVPFAQTLADTWQFWLEQNAASD